MRSLRTCLRIRADAEARTSADFDEDFPPPHGKSDDELITESRAVAPKTVDKKAVFTKHGLEEDYVKSGNALIAVFETALGEPTRL